MDVFQRPAIALVLVNVNTKSIATPLLVSRLKRKKIQLFYFPFRGCYLLENWHFEVAKGKTLEKLFENPLENPSYDAFEKVTDNADSEVIFATKKDLLHIWDTIHWIKYYYLSFKKTH